MTGKLWESEQISRLGNIHVIYPALSREHYQKIIENNLNQLRTDFWHAKDIALTFDASIAELIYQEGVFPTQGVRPYLLKEYLGRWYLACKFEHGKKMYSYALDRMTDLEISDKTFDASDVPDPEQFFSFSIGVSVSVDDEPEEIQLSILPEQIKYLKTLPLHKSQKIVSESKSEVIISLKVVVNFELVQKILMLGERAKVIKPASLVKEIKSTLEEALKRYEQSATP